MGLTLHFEFGDDRLTPARAEALVHAWHAHARGPAGFAEGSQVFHDLFDEDHGNGLVPGLRFLTVPADPAAPPPDPDPLAARITALAEDLTGPDGAEFHTVRASDSVDLIPEECWFFWTTAAGAEPLLLGLARYPETVTAPDGTAIPTGLSRGWHWQGFTRTQYANAPEHGGPDHFVRVHTGFVNLLGRVAQDLPAIQITDDSGYADHRDADRLRREVDHWDAVTAAFAGRLKDAKLDIQAPIMDRPDFEHLEADGEAALRKRRDDRDDRDAK